MSLFLWRFGWGLVWLWIGALVGAAILGIDHLVYVAVYPHELTPQRVIQFLKAKQVREAYRLLRATTEERARLFFKQALGQVVLLILGFYLLTSGGSLFGRGLILSINLVILKQVWGGFLTDRQKLKVWLFQHVRGEVSDEGLKGYVFVVTMVFLFLSVLGVRS